MNHARRIDLRNLCISCASCNTRKSWNDYCGDDGGNCSSSGRSASAQSENWSRYYECAFHVASYFFPMKHLLQHNINTIQHNTTQYTPPLPIAVFQNHTLPLESVQISVGSDTNLCTISHTGLWHLLTQCQMSQLQVRICLIKLIGLHAWNYSRKYTIPNRCAMNE